MNDAVKGELITVIGRQADDIEDGVSIDYFLWIKPGFENAEKKLREAVQRFLQTDEGKRIAEKNYGYTWGDALYDIPSDFWISQNLVPVSGEVDINVTYLSVIEIETDEKLA